MDTSTYSPLTVKDEPDSSTTNPVTVSTQSERTSQPDTVLTVIENPEITVSTSGKRLKGKGTGRIQWRTVTKKNGKQYQQAWYDWQVHEGGKTKTRTKYIPKRLLAKVQALEAAKVPVPEVLRVLGVGKKRSPLSKSKTLTQFLGDKPNPDYHQISPREKRRNQGLGSGSIEWRLNKGKYLEAYYHYEFWEKGDRLVKKSRYIPKRLLSRVEKLEEEKAPVREILILLGVKL